MDREVELIEETVIAVGETTWSYSRRHSNHSMSEHSISLTILRGLYSSGITKWSLTYCDCCY